MFYMLPESIVEMPFEVHRLFRRGNFSLYETQSDRDKYPDDCKLIFGESGEVHSTLTSELIAFISRHFIDAKIPNPDLKEMYLTRLNFLMQFQQFIEIFERDKYAKTHLIQMLLKSFDKKNMFLVSKNFLRFCKGRGFKEISFANPETGIEDTYSEFYLLKIREQLMIPGDKLNKDFMNTFFNAINDLTTELFVIFKELKNNYNAQILKRTRLLFQMVVDMYRILELLTKWVPELFVDKTQIHSSRLLNYIMFVLHSIFVGKIDNYIELFATKI